MHKMFRMVNILNVTGLFYPKGKNYFLLIFKLQKKQT